LVAVGDAGVGVGDIGIAVFVAVAAGVSVTVGVIAGTGVGVLTSGKVGVAGPGVEVGKVVMMGRAVDV